MSHDVLMPVGFADELAAAIAYAMHSHSHFSRRSRDAFRYWDGITPAAIHPIWCAMTLLTEIELSADIRYHGCLALLWHDILEDTTLPLPPNIPPVVRTLVEEMTFANLQEEIEQIEKCSDMARLLKLYDKVSGLLDSAWMNDRKWQQVVTHTRKLIAFVETTYGDLNIVKIAHAICQSR